MTEAATVRVLEETEALVDEARAATKLLGEAQARAAGVEILTEPMNEVEALVERSHARAMAIMSALEFQDLTTQKVQRTFNVLEEVLLRLGKIRRLVDNGAHQPPAPADSRHRPTGLRSESGRRDPHELRGRGWRPSQPNRSHARHHRPRRRHRQRVRRLRARRRPDARPVQPIELLIIGGAPWARS